MKKLIVLLLNVLVLTGCGDRYDDKVSSTSDTNKLQQREKELQKAVFNLSKVSVARLTVDGEKHEVTSIVPETLTKFKDSLTLLAFNDKQDQLVLFTYDALSGKGYEASLVLPDFEAKKSIKFPVVNSADGKLVDRVFALNALIVR